MLIWTIKQHIDLMLAGSSHFSIALGFWNKELQGDIIAEKDYYKVLLSQTSARNGV